MATVDSGSRTTPLGVANGASVTPAVFDAVVVGGFGHVGLPLAVSLAGAGRQICALDINADMQKRILAGEVPFKEDGCEEVFARPSLAGPSTPASMRRLCLMRRS